MSELEKVSDERIEVILTWLASQCDHTRVAQDCRDALRELRELRRMNAEPCYVANCGKGKHHTGSCGSALSDTEALVRELATAIKDITDDGVALCHAQSAPCNACVRKVKELQKLIEQESVRRILEAK
jgi:hypothetical protein